jgi:hypothetical protein
MPRSLHRKRPRLPRWGAIKCRRWLIYPSRQGDYRNPGGVGIEELVERMSPQLARFCRRALPQVVRYGRCGLNVILASGRWPCRSRCRQRDGERPERLIAARSAGPALKAEQDDPLHHTPPPRKSPSPGAAPYQFQPPRRVAKHPAPTADSGPIGEVRLCHCDLCHAAMAQAFLLTREFDLNATGHCW